MAHILVTGGAGYIGSHACKALERAGHLPVVYDNLITGHREAVRWGPFEHGDILDEARLAQVLERYRPAAVMHFAAFAYVGESMTDPAKYYRNNVEGSLSLLRVVRAVGVGAFVLSSSCATYGDAETDLIVETHRQAPINPYGRSKLICEQMLADYCAAYGLSGVALRYFNAAGADEDGELGEEHDPETHLIPLVLQTAAGSRESISVFGNDYDTPDGTCIRDYLHVADLADAHVRGLDRLLNGQDGFEAFNLGTGTGISVQQVIDGARRVTNRAIPVAMAPRRAGDPPRLVADPSRAHTMLGWRATRSELDNLLGSAWNWMNRGQDGHDA